MRQDQQRQFVIVFCIIIAVVILTLGLVLGLKSTPDEEEKRKYKDCVEIQSSPNRVENLKKLDDGICHRSIQDNRQYGLNTEQCGYDGGDCVDFNKRFVNCVPGTHPSELDDLGKTRCKSKYNTKECGYDDGKCNTFNRFYPECKGDPFLVGDGLCHPDGIENTKDCGWDGGDCLFSDYPDCKGVDPREFNNTICNKSLNKDECNFDGGDCDVFNILYPDCKEDPEKIGNKICNLEGKENTQRCGWDGGDCLIPGLPFCFGINPSDYKNNICNNELNKRECNYDGGDCKMVNEYPSCKGDFKKLGDRVCHPNGKENTKECGWDGGDCLIPPYPDCTGIDPNKFNDEKCHKELNRRECDYDGGDCFFFNRLFPNCDAPEPFRVGDDICDDDDEKKYNNFYCQWDGQDCSLDGWPDCEGIDPAKYKNKVCDHALNSEVCNFDGGDCDDFNNRYPDCDSLDPSRVGDGTCDDDELKIVNNEECGWDGGDCLISFLPDCKGKNKDKYNDGQCDLELNIEKCNFDGKDCKEFNDLYPDCLAPEPHRVGDGTCDNDASQTFNNQDCFWDGTDCMDFNRKYPGCTGNFLKMGDGTCDEENDTEKCKYDAGDCF